MRRHAADGDSPLLEVEALSVEFHRSRDRSPIQVLDRLSFTIGSGEIVGLVGESGCGKSTLALALLRLLPPAGARTGGVVRFRGRDVESLSGAELCALRGSGMGLLPQESMSALHPTRTIGSQLDEAIHTHHPVGSTFAATRAAGRERALELLELVALADPQRRLREFPHQLSGGERQRVALALALAAEPELLVADEPTSALDTTTQSRILDLFEALRERLGLSILLISHDLALVGERCERALVLYGGILVESGPLPALLEHPRHPYSRALLQTVPRLGDRHARGQLPVIAGTVHEPGETPRGCVFEPRCSERLSTCADERPAWRAISANEGVRCVLPTISEPSSPPPG